MAVKVVFLTTVGAGTWPIPADWSNTNTIEVIGGGGAGSESNTSSEQGGGGGGGGYALISNLTGLSGNINYTVGAGGTAPNGAGGDTWFNGTAVGTASVSAHGGGGATTAAAPGAGGAGVNGTTLHTGGSGPAFVDSGTEGGNGGGGAAGPRGNGGAGGSSLGGAGGGGGGGSGGGGSGTNGAAGGHPAASAAGAGGNNAAGAGSGAGATTGTGAGTAGTLGGGGGGGGWTAGSGGAGGNGGAGADWTQTSDSSTAGAGGGGGGGGDSNTAVPGNGGLYGGGGAGSGGTSNTHAGSGAQGIIIITYTTSVAATPVWLPETPVDQVPQKSQTWFQHSPPSQILLPSTVPPQVGGMPWFEPPDFYNPPRRFTVEAPPALNLVPSTLPPKVAGIGWFHPRDVDVPARRVTVESPASFTLRPSTLSQIAGIGWFEPPDRDAPPRRPTVESLPAIDLIPQTVPPKIAGMAWFNQPEVVLARRRVVDDIMAWCPQAFTTAAPSWTLIATVSGANGGSALTTAGINTTGADLIVVVASSYFGAPGTLTDSNNNTWFSAVAPGSNGRQIDTIFYAWGSGLVVGPAHTFTWNDAGAGTFGSIQVAAWQGSLISSNPLDQTNSAFFGSGTTTEQAGSITPTQGNELIIFGTGIDDTNGSTFSIDSSFTLQEVTDVIAGSMFGSSLSSLVQGGAAPVNPTFTRSVAIAASRNDTALIASFKGAGVAPSTIAGMAWFVTPDRDAPARKSVPETMPAWSPQPIVTPGAPVGGIGWFEPADDLPRKLRLFPDVPPLPVLTQININWEFFSTDTLWLPDPPIPVALAYVAPAPPSPTVQISGIGWFEPRDVDPPPRRPTVEQPLSAAVILATTLPAPPYGWWIQPDRDAPARKSTVEQLWSSVLIPSTLPVGMRGIPWLILPDRDAPPRRPTVESLVAWDPQFVTQVVATTQTRTHPFFATMGQLMGF